MYVQRCPECGGRLNTNYCDICMRKVPFGGVKLAKRRDPWDSRDGSSAHRMEKNHECISFSDEQKPKKTTFTKPQRKTVAPNKKGASVVAIILAVFSLLPAIFGLVEEFTGSEQVLEPEYNVYEGFVVAGDPGAEDVPNVVAGEIYNNDGIRITVDDAGLSYGEYTVLMTVHNETDQNISVSMDLVSANGYMVPYGVYHDIRAGRSEQTYITFYSHELEKAGITQVADVAFVLDVYETDSYEEIVVREPVAFQTDYDGSAEAAVDISGLELYNDGSFRVILRDIMLDDYGDCELDLYMENLSGSTVNVYSGEVAVNGEAVSGYISKTLRSDTRAADRAYIYELDERADLDIEELSRIKEITIDLYVEYMDGWNIVESFSEAVTFEPNAMD